MTLETSASKDLKRLLISEESARDLSDGRHMRSERSRQKIVSALMELVSERNMEPTQAEVAERADVSFRTVSRHFEDMESLYRHCVRRVQSELLDEFLAPFEATDWRGRVDELIRRRAAAYDVFLPYREFANLRRFRSDFMRHVYHDNIAFEVSSLTALLPSSMQEDDVFVASLESMLCFDAWRRMRYDRGFSSEQALAVFERSAASLLAPYQR